MNMIRIVLMHWHFRRLLAHAEALDKDRDLVADAGFRQLIDWQLRRMTTE